ncbi:MAG TPA: hypothetical protein PKC24_14985 [Cyclobacteriaceae bacterium]|mgnify:CR=1 FL=1|nr:hypothetical protein [Cyclobacteriaceae bacterium]
MYRFFKLLAVFLLFLLLLPFCFIAPIDRKDLKEQHFYQQMMQQFDEAEFQKFPSSTSLKIGWSKVNIMTSYPMPMAGYNRVGNYDSVHDSLYTRIMAIDNGNVITYLINADLLIFPPDLKAAIENELELHGRTCELLYYGATHTHHGTGAWEDNHLGEIMMGDYDANWIAFASQSILRGLDLARHNTLPATLNFWDAFAGDFVKNRLTGNYLGMDDYLRGIEVLRADSSRALMITYSAHPTSIDRHHKIVSADYPAPLIDYMENVDYDFAMFMAGAVGSHSKAGFCKSDFELCEEAGQALAGRIKQSMARSDFADELDIQYINLPVIHGPSQARISKNLRIRDWFFKFMNGELKGYVKVLVLGDIVLLGTSNDFSGELLVRKQIPAYANALGKKIIVTSFNGDYTGYITYDNHYHNHKPNEVSLMNWVGPYFGNYYTEIILKLLDKLAED